MPKPKLYSVAYKAQRELKDSHTRMTVEAVTAHSQNEALSAAMELAITELPPEEGWFGHVAMVFEIPDKMIRSVRN